MWLDNIKGWTWSVDDLLYSTQDRTRCEGRWLKCPIKLPSDYIGQWFDDDGIRGRDMGIEQGTGNKKLEVAEI